MEISLSLLIGCNVPFGRVTWGFLFFPPSTFSLSLAPSGFCSLKDFQLVDDLFAACFICPTL